MSYDIVYSDAFLRAVKILVKKYPSLKQDIQNLVSELTKQPDTGISLGKNLLKIKSRDFVKEIIKEDKEVFTKLAQ